MTASRRAQLRYCTVTVCANPMKMCVCVCVCMCCRPIYSERRFSPLGRVSRGHTGGRPTHRRFFFFICFWFSTFLLRCLPFFFVARRVQHSLSLVDREVECCVPATKSLSTVGCCARKKPRLLRDLNPRPNRQKVTRLPTEPPGRPASVRSMKREDYSVVLTFSPALPHILRKHRGHVS